MGRMMYLDEDAQQFFPWEPQADPHKPTNADKIRSMTDEELAEMFAKLVDCNECKLYKYNKCMASEDACLSQWLEWLKKESAND